MKQWASNPEGMFPVQSVIEVAIPSTATTAGADAAYVLKVPAHRRATGWGQHGFTSYATSASPGLYDAIKELTEEVRALKVEIASMRGASIEYRDVSQPQAFDEVAALLKTESELYPSEISQRLHIHYDTVVEALEVLRSQGKVEL